MKVPQRFKSIIQQSIITSTPAAPRTVLFKDVLDTTFDEQRNYREEIAKLLHLMRWS
jgi:hypothetical protein